MEKPKPIFFLPEEKSKQLGPVLRKVKKQVKRYREAKKAGTLRKVSEEQGAYLFNV